ncbi:hypothetical protein AB0K12_39220 [Nonomuraea sp. NPDC049419]|uniref:hypothetical protein n=1 Tax=Nonomuraea sp. NPDC049419 TaxID=3155772 RepID=UPI00341733AD
MTSDVEQADAPKPQPTGEEPASRRTARATEPAPEQPVEETTPQRPAAQTASEHPADGGQEPISARMRQFAEAVGPTTLATAVLIYFGYVATRARFDYFGVSLEMADLSNQSLLLYGLEVVYVPAALMCLGALLVIAVHAAVSRQLARRPGDPLNTFMAAVIALIGVLLVARALIGMFLQDAQTSVVIGTTPLALASGPAAVAYGIHVHGKNRGRPLLSPRLARNGVLSVAGLAVAGLFWASTTVAWAYGIGLGEQDAAELPQRAEVVIDVKQELHDVPPGITHTRLRTTDKDPGYEHRYRGFRLLLASGGRLFLVNSRWKLGRDQTIVLPYDGGVRIQLISQP